jgi:2,3-bisphosphoglycerate-independent phosphoglycerate mutase
VAVRGNFCTVDASGVVQDRRAGRIPTERNQELCGRLREIQLDGAELSVQTVKEHRFLLVLRGDDLSGEVDDTDPQEVGRKPLAPHPTSGRARETAQLLEQFVAGAREVLSGEENANMVLLRGAASLPDWPRFSETYGVRAAAVAGYPMYRGLARLIGMDVVEAGSDIGANTDLIRQRWSDYDFFFLHVKGTDSSGEDGNFPRKVAYLEEVDQALPKLLDLQPEVLVVTGDHSTPSALKSHSWHPVPALLWSGRCRPDAVQSFGESACIGGALGPRFQATDLMPLAMANALRLDKFGA